MSVTESTIHPEPGDVIVIRVDQRLPRENLDALRVQGLDRFPGHEVVVCATGVTIGTLDVDALERRVQELEDRINEAGRRALSHAQRKPIEVQLGQEGVLQEAPADWLADVGRALLFDSETPDPGSPQG